MIPDWTIGDRLAKARKAADLSVGEMAEKLDVHRNSISSWENDHHRPRRRDLLAWSHITGVAVEWLTEGNAGATGKYVTHDIRYVTRHDLALAA